MVPGQLRQLRQLQQQLLLQLFLSVCALASDYFGTPVGSFRNRLHDVQGEVGVSQSKSGASFVVVVAAVAAVAVAAAAVSLLLLLLLLLFLGLL